MPTGKNWLNFIYINVVFVGFVFSLYYFISIQDIKDNWPQYRCNPMYMPLSDNIEQDFTYCVQTMQTNYMGFLLQPLTFITSSLTDMAGNFSKQINDVRNMFSQTRGSFLFVKLHREGKAESDFLKDNQVLLHTDTYRHTYIASLLACNLSS